MTMFVHWDIADMYRNDFIDVMCHVVHALHVLTYYLCVNHM